MKTKYTDEKCLEGNGDLLKHYGYCLEPTSLLTSLIRSKEDKRSAFASQMVFITEENETLEKVWSELTEHGFAASPQSVAGRFASVMKFYGEQGMLKVGIEAIMFVDMLGEMVPFVFWREAGQEKIKAGLFSPNNIKLGTLIIATKADSIRYY